MRVFEWNGTMLHAKTAVADGHWARVGSTNLNIASWLGNCELDAIVEDEPFARRMEEMYLEDLSHATEIVLEGRRRGRVRERTVHAEGEGVHAALPHHPRLAGTRRGSAGRAAAGAIRIGNAISAAFTNRRTLGPVEARLAAIVGLVLFAAAVLFALFPRVLAYPVVAVLTWVSLALLYRGYKLHRAGSVNPPPR